MSNCKPIGFFDSGVGGISVLKTAAQLMPNENYIYFGDNANAPYGQKSKAEIKQLSLEAVNFLFSKGVKAIVMACNTATSAAVQNMREEYRIPVISMEPAVKPALQCVRAGKVLVLATPATVSQARYHRLLSRLDAKDKVVNLGCGGLVELIENGLIDETSIHDYLDEKLRDISPCDIDAVVLGCTHYAFVEAHIKSFLQNKYQISCEIHDGRHGTVRYLKHVLQERDITCINQQKGSIQYFSSGQATDISAFKKLFSQFTP